MFCYSNSFSFLLFSFNSLSFYCSSLSAYILLILFLKQNTVIIIDRKNIMVIAPIPYIYSLNSPFVAEASYKFPLSEFKAIFFYMKAYLSFSSSYKLLPSFKDLSTHFLYLFSITTFSGSIKRSSLPFFFMKSVT